MTLSKSKKLTSSDDGTILIQEINDKDVSYLKQIQQESGVEVKEIEDFESDNSGSGNLDVNESDMNQEIVINLTNPFGENKKLIIKFIQK